MGQLSFATEKMNELFSQIQRGASLIKGTLNITNENDINTAQSELIKSGEVVFYLVTDSYGKLPSKNQNAVNLTSNIIKKLNYSSPNSTINSTLNTILNNTTFDDIGVNVGDIIALARVSVSVTDLLEALGISSTLLSGTIEMYQYKVWNTYDAKPSGYKNPDGSIIPNGVSGLATPNDKDLLSKFPEKLNIIDRLPTIAGNDFNMDDCLETGIYPWCASGRPNGATGHFTLVVQKASSPDYNNNYTVHQTAYGREADEGKIYNRVIFVNGSNKEYHAWVRVDTDERINTVQQRITGLEQGMSPFYYPFVSLGHIGGDGTSATQELLNQAIDDLVDRNKTPDRGGVFRALYNGSQIIIEQYATNYATDRFIQVVRGSIGIVPTNTMKVGFRAYEFNVLYRTHNGAVNGFTEWMAMPTASTLAYLEKRIEALENK